MKRVLQYGQALSLTAKGFAGVADSAVEPGVATGSVIAWKVELKRDSTENRAPVCAEPLHEIDVSDNTMVR